MSARARSGTNEPILGDFGSAAKRLGFATMSALFNRSSLARKAPIMTHSATPRRAFGARLLRHRLHWPALQWRSLPPSTPSGRRGRPAHHRRANPVVHWNLSPHEAYAPTQGLDPLAQSRTFAIMHASMHDALNAIDAATRPTRRACPQRRAPRSTPPSPRPRAKCWSR